MYICMRSSTATEMFFFHSQKILVFRKPSNVLGKGNDQKIEKGR